MPKAKVSHQTCLLNFMLTRGDEIAVLTSERETVDAVVIKLAQYFTELHLIQIIIICGIGTKCIIAIIFERQQYTDQ